MITPTVFIAGPWDGQIWNVEEATLFDTVSPQNTFGGFYLLTKRLDTDDRQIYEWHQTALLPDFQPD